MGPLSLAGGCPQRPDGTELPWPPLAHVCPELGGSGAVPRPRDDTSRAHRRWVSKGGHSGQPARRPLGSEMPLLLWFCRIYAARLPPAASNFTVAN